MAILYSVLVSDRGGSRIFSRGGVAVDFRKIFESFVDLFFRHFLENFEILTEKLRFFGRRSPLPKIRRRRLEKSFKVDRPKLDFLKVPQGGPFGSAGGRIPEEGMSALLPAPLNPPLGSGMGGAANKIRKQVR